MSSGDTNEDDGHAWVEGSIAGCLDPDVRSTKYV